MTTEPQTRLLKTDLFGQVRLCESDTGDDPMVQRDTTLARWWLKPLARRLAAREARALKALDGVRGIPVLLGWRGGVLARRWIPGRPMQEARPRNPEYFRQAFRLLCGIHRCGVVHNDLAKEPNWLVLDDGGPALVDFQLAGVLPGRGRVFRLLAREDLRHFLKHKRYYCADSLTRRELAILNRPAWISRLWMATGKKAYLWLTRRILGWSDREGAGDRHL